MSEKVRKYRYGKCAGWYKKKKRKAPKKRLNERDQKCMTGLLSGDLSLG